MMGRERVLRFCADQRDEMERIWRRRGRYESAGNAYCAWVFATHAPSGPEAWTGDEWPPGPPLGKTTPIRCELPSFIRALRPGHRNTDVFSQVLRKFVQATKAEGTLICSEAWYKTYGNPDDKDFDAAEATRLRAEDPFCLGDAPGAREALFMSLEHIAVGRRAWRSDISRSPLRLEPWQEMNMTRSPTDTLMVGFIQTGS